MPLDVPTFTVIGYLDCRCLPHARTHTPAYAHHGLRYVVCRAVAHSAFAVPRLVTYVYGLQFYTFYAFVAADHYRRLPHTPHAHTVCGSYSGYVEGTFRFWTCAAHGCGSVYSTVRGSAVTRLHHTTVQVTHLPVAVQVYGYVHRLRLLLYSGCGPFTCLRVLHCRWLRCHLPAHFLTATTCLPPTTSTVVSHAHDVKISALAWVVLPRLFVLVYTAFCGCPPSWFGYTTFTRLDGCATAAATCCQHLHCCHRLIPYAFWFLWLPGCFCLGYQFWLRFALTAICSFYTCLLPFNALRLPPLYTKDTFTAPPFCATATAPLTSSAFYTHVFFSAFALPRCQLPLRTVCHCTHTNDILYTHAPHRVFGSCSSCTRAIAVYSPSRHVHAMDVALPGLHYVTYA